MRRFLSPSLVARFSSHHHHHHTKVGFIGLGNMGAPMATNLALKGYTVYAFDTNQARYPEFNSKGLKTVPTVPELIQHANLIVTMLPNSNIVAKLCEETLFPNLQMGSMILDSSTISPLVAQELSEKAKIRNINYLDCPVSGGVGAAAAGTLTFMVGTQDEKLFNKAKKILQNMGKNIFQCGGPGTGQIAKMCNNLALAIQMVSIAESLSLGKSLGMDIKILSDVMKVSSGRCWSLDTYNPVPGVIAGVPSSRNYENGFSCELMLKDLNISKSVSESIGKEGILAKKTIDTYEELLKLGYGKKDFSVIYEYIENLKAKKIN